MDKMTRRSLLDLLARGGLACGGCCAFSRFALLDALAADADDANPFQVSTVDFHGRRVSRLGSCRNTPAIESSPDFMRTHKAAHGRLCFWGAVAKGVHPFGILV